MPEELHAAQDLPLHRKLWIAERTGWFGIVVIVGLAIAGFFGHGPVSGAKAEAQSFTLEYDRYLRFGKPTQIRIIAASDDPGYISVRLNSDYLGRFHVRSIAPQPVSWSLASGETILKFDSDQGEHTIVLHLEPLKRGRASAQVGVGHESVNISQLILP